MKDTPDDWYMSDSDRMRLYERQRDQLRADLARVTEERDDLYARTIKSRSSGSWQERAERAEAARDKAEALIVAYELAEALGPNCGAYLDAKTKLLDYGRELLARKAGT